MDRRNLYKWVNFRSATTTEKPKEKKTGGPHYFAWFEGKLWPEKPTHPITEQEAKSPAYNGSYFVAYFDSDGRLLTIQKILNGKPDWRSEYKYDSAGMAVEWVRTDGEGHRVAFDVDADGKLKKQASGQVTMPEQKVPNSN